MFAEKSELMKRSRDVMGNRLTACEKGEVAMKAKKILGALLLMCGRASMTSLARLGRADVLILKDGQAVTGKYQGGDTGGITFLVGGEYRRYSISDVHSLTILPVGSSNASSNASAPPSYEPPPPPAPSQGPGYSSGRS